MNEERNARQDRFIQQEGEGATAQEVPPPLEHHSSRKPSQRPTLDPPQPSLLHPLELTPLCLRKSVSPSRLGAL